MVFAGEELRNFLKDVRNKKILGQGTMPMTKFVGKGGIGTLLKAFQ